MGSQSRDAHTPVEDPDRVRSQLLSYGLYPRNTNILSTSDGVRFGAWAFGNFGTNGFSLRPRWRYIEIPLRRSVPNFVMVSKSNWSGIRPGSPTSVRGEHSVALPSYFAQQYKGYSPDRSVSCIEQLLDIDTWHLLLSASPSFDIEFLVTRIFLISYGHWLPHDSVQEDPIRRMSPTVAPVLRQGIHEKDLETQAPATVLSCCQSRDEQ